MKNENSFIDLQLVLRFYYLQLVWSEHNPEGLLFVVKSRHAGKNVRY